jgi:multisubunit Na+/H+ antiporter MnhB subunit
VKRVFAIPVILGAAAFAGLLIAAMLDLPDAAIDLRLAVVTHLIDSGVEHPVTAVLLNYRGYDTLLEIAVLLLALLGLLAAADRTAAPAAPPTDPLLQTLARVAAPLAIVFAVYLLWAGAFRPGGAFQAGAVLAAGAVLLHLVGLTPGWAQPRLALRAGLAGGFLLFLAIAAALLANGALLQYPPAVTGQLILAIEAGLTLSLGLILAGLFLFLS